MNLQMIKLLLDSTIKTLKFQNEEVPRPATPFKLGAVTEPQAVQFYKQFLLQKSHHRYDNRDWFRAGMAFRERLDGLNSEFPKGSK